VFLACARRLIVAQPLLGLRRQVRGRDLNGLEVSDLGGGHAAFIPDNGCCREHNRDMTCPLQGLLLANEVCIGDAPVATNVFDGRQLTAARALAELTVVELAEAAGVTTRTINRLEIGGVTQIAPRKRHGHVSYYVWNKILEALARHGVELVPESEDHGSGARWIEPRSHRRELPLGEAVGPT
jgi:DNA-binding XRE family transcriptional regulator